MDRTAASALQRIVSWHAIELARSLTHSDPRVSADCRRKPAEISARADISAEAASSYQLLAPLIFSKSPDYKQLTMARPDPRFGPWSAISM